MLGERTYLLPLSLFILLPTTFLVSYMIAVMEGHVEPGFPYISDAGAESPESCVFGQLLNICAFLAAATVYVRYKEVELMTRRLSKLNKVALIMGLLASLGVSIVANFQESNVVVVHLIGALIAFGLGSIYCWLQTIITYKGPTTMTTPCWKHLRVVCSIVMSVTFLFTFVFDFLSKKHFHGKNPRKWYPQDGGFTLHIISTSSEWTMSMAFLTFFLSYVSEFRHISLASPQLHLPLTIEYEPIR